MALTGVDWGAPFRRRGRIVKGPTISGLADDPVNQANQALAKAEYDARVRAAKKKNSKDFIKAGITGAAVVGGSAGLSSIFSGGASAGGANPFWGQTGPSGIGRIIPGGASGTGPAGLDATSAAKAGLGSRLSSIFSNPNVGVGIQAGTALLANRSNNKAATVARLDMLNAQREQLALERARLEIEANNANLDREEARALNAAINELKKRELDAAEEARAFERGEYEKEQTRLGPYRNISESALRRLSSMWGI